MGISESTPYYLTSAKHSSESILRNDKKEMAKKFILTVMILFLLISCNIFNKIEPSIINVNPLVKTEEIPIIFQYLYPIESNGKWGYINKFGEIKIRPIFAKAEEFKRNRAAVKIGDFWGFINPDGEIIIEPKFDEVLSFYSDFTKVRIKHVWMYIDADGEHLIGLEKFRDIDNFSEGLASASSINRENEGRGFIDQKGNVVIGFKFSETGSFQNGLTPVSVRERGFFYYNFLFRYFYINHNGKQAFPFDSYEFLPDFSDGLAAVPDYFFGKKSYGYINTNGQMVIKPQFDEAYSFSEGIATVRIDEQLYIIDKSGRIIAKSPSSEPVYFSEGIAVARSNGKFGYIDRAGKMVINPIFDFAGNFYGGIAQVKIGSKLGYINTKGDYIWLQSSDTRDS
ncbi:WG repeat-containing protein [Pseudanabaena sp. UWO310]|uniref:WG repeat-containing protein n=1 Tax=Pseudanabaena sp. UWO310 TaxID=2480795 RepID=UPI00115B6D36|nr:WG repeat-containing protein [Pseudanabaena sp. UWO310]TYQ30105.1 WG repeat-containing protein [Pseudanabaena sp. UWO310]